MADACAELIKGHDAIVMDVDLLEGLQQGPQRIVIETQCLPEESDLCLRLAADICVETG